LKIGSILDQCVHDTSNCLDLRGDDFIVSYSQNLITRLSLGL
jgi:hypothetical protein